MTGDIYGHKGASDKISVEPCITGGDVTDEYGAVRVEDPEVPHTFLLTPDRTRDKAERVEEHSEDQSAAASFAQRLRAAADIAEKLEDDNE